MGHYDEQREAIANLQRQRAEECHRRWKKPEVESSVKEIREEMAALKAEIQELYRRLNENQQ